MKRILMLALPLILAGTGISCLSGCVYRIGGIEMTSSNPREADSARQKAAHLKIGEITGYIHPLLVVEDVAIETVTVVKNVGKAVGVLVVP